MLSESSSKRSKSNSSKSKKSYKGNSLKFEAGFVTILIFAGIIFIVDIVDKWDGILHYVFTEIILFNVIIIFYQWVYLYISSVTREKRALFDEGNILETYQPRAYTHGHLFTPDPPTPAELENKDQPIKRSEQEKSEFNKLRDAHYDNMYQKALDLSKALEAENEAAKLGESKKINEKNDNITKNCENSKNDKECSVKSLGEEDIIKL